MNACAYPPPEPPTINVTDSLVMVDLYHSMKLGEWGEAYNWDLTDPESWIGIGFQTDENGLKYVNKIRIILPVGGIKLIKDLCIKSCAYY